MKSKVLLMVVISILVSLPSVLFGRNITLPFEYRFDTSAGDYADMIWNRPQDAPYVRHDWESSGGWSGGAAKFTLIGEGNDYYAGLGGFNDINGGSGSTRLNIRFLIYWGSTILNHGKDAEPKSIILNRKAPHTATTYRALGYWKWGSEESAWYLKSCGQNDLLCSYSYSGREGNVRQFILTNYLNQWICLEWEYDIITGQAKTFVTTQDGVYNQAVTMQHAVGYQNVGVYDYITIIGRYGNTLNGPPDANSYFKIDELRIDNSYIGPPPGFVSGVPLPPTGLRIVP